MPSKYFLLLLAAGKFHDVELTPVNVATKKLALLWCAFLVGLNAGT